MRTLIEKELRENLRWLLVGLALIGSLLWYAVPKSLAAEILHTENSLATMMFFGSAIFAIGLGVVQSFADLRTASRSFLFHRSVSISTIFYSKLISGAVIYFATVGLPLLVVALWFAWQGIDYLPVRPMQIYPAAVTALACFGFHPAAMFMLARSGRWFGTKLLPLVFVLPLIPLGLSTLDYMMHGLAINLLTVGLILLGIVTLVMAARSAWVHSLADEGINPRRPIGFAHIAILSLASILVCSMGIALVRDFASGSFWRVPSSEREEYAFDVEGNPWRVKSTGRSLKKAYISGDRLREDEVPDVRRKLPENLKLRGFHYLSELRRPAPGCFANEWRFAGDRQSYFDSRGNVLIYDRTLKPPLQTTVSRNGKPFVGNPQSDLVRMSSMILFQVSEDQLDEFWVDSEGIYRYSETSQLVRTLAELPIDALGVFDSSRRQFFILSEGRIHLYGITDQEGNEWVRPTAESPTDAWNFAIKEISVTPPLPTTSASAIKICIIGDSKYTVVLDGPRPTFLTINSESDTSWSYTYFRRPNSELAHVRRLDISLLPWLSSIIVSVVATIGNLVEGKTFSSIDEFSYIVQVEYAYLILAIFVVLLSSIATSYACRRRMLNRSQTVQWCCWALLLGLATPLAVLAIYTRPTCSRCLQCEKQRRVDFRKCEHCGAEWDRPALKGIEIFDESILGGRPKGAARQVGVT